MVTLLPGQRPTQTASDKTSDKIVTHVDWATVSASCSGLAVSSMSSLAAAKCVEAYELFYNIDNTVQSTTYHWHVDEHAAISTLAVLAIVLKGLSLPRSYRRQR